MKKFLKKYGNIIFLLVLVSLTTKVILNKNSLHDIVQVIKTSNMGYISCGLMAMVIFWMLEAWMIDVLLKKTNYNSRFWLALKITFIGQYYSYLTPFASGGQPAQLYELNRDNIPMSSATAVLVSKFLLFQITVTVYALILTLFKFRMVVQQLTLVYTFVFMGLLINMVGLFLFILLVFKVKILKKFLKKIIRFLYRIRIIKDDVKYINKINHFIEEYKICIKMYLDDLRMTFILFIASIVQVTTLFMITYFVYRAFGLNVVSVYTLIILQSILYMAVAFIPTPGTVGAAEAGFALVFGSVFPSNLLSVALLLWRGITYYFGLIVCGIFTLYVYLFDRRRIRNSKLI